jgi:hypothetical protein
MYTERATGILGAINEFVTVQIASISGSHTVCHGTLVHYLQNIKMIINVNSSRKGLGNTEFDRRVWSPGYAPGSAYLVLSVLLV